jgi:hypothetical protein
MGIAELDKDRLLLTIKAHIILYGDAANEMLARQVAEEIEIHWNAARAQVFIRDTRYNIVFSITATFDNELKPSDVFENDNPANNYFRVEEFSESHISFVDGIGSNTGYFKLDNLLNNSTTAAHEFGHTLGLLHPDHLDIRGRGTPGIMYPRGTIVDAHFQYDPDAAPASIGGTMNPFHRKVLQKDIDDLKLHKLSFDKNGRAIVGNFSSVWHRKHLPH